jgi:hypothetical protein
LSYLAVYVKIIPRRQGIAGFYGLVIIVGLLFFINAIKDNLIVGTTLMGISRIFSSNSLKYSATAYTLIASMQTEAFTV